MSKRSMKIVLISALLLVMIFAGCDRKPKGSLKGKIYDELTSELVTQNVTVSLDGKTDVVTGGEYLLERLSEGERTLKAQADGYEAYTACVQIIGEEITEHDIYLTPPIQDPVFTIDEVLVPGAESFPIGHSDNEECTEVNYPYFMAQYAVTYDLWKEVYDWATSDDRGAEIYHFQNEGQMGSTTGEEEKTGQHPVTGISWRDTIVWSNALTEYYNAKNDPRLALDCVYLDNGEVIRDSRDENAAAFDTMDFVEGAKGYRLPTGLEWELAARYQDGVEWTPGMHVSGDTTGPCFAAGAPNESVVYGDYAWHRGNSDNSTHPVGEKLPNALDIYDMSGNVTELTTDRHQTNETQWATRGGSYATINWTLPLATEVYIGIDFIGSGLGMRVVRTQ